VKKFILAFSSLCLVNLLGCAPEQNSQNSSTPEVSPAVRAQAQQAVNLETKNSLAAFQNLQTPVAAPAALMELGMANTANYPSVTQKALNGLVRTAVLELHAKGFHKGAKKYSAQWEATYANYFLTLSTKDLGDHAPLSQWLTGFYNYLESNLGHEICHIFHFDDIFIFNYAIPVVFHPRGLHGDTWDSVEYGKHFVPFAAATTYWSCRVACTVLVPGIVLEFFCSELAEVPRYVMQESIAPPLSDYVYNLFNKPGSNPHSPQFDVDQLLAKYQPQH
jgi:hypothetical protein